MYPGYVTMGQGDPRFDPTFTEIINNSRAYAYVRQSDITWLQECTDCPETQTVVPGFGVDGWLGVVEDPAPWYDPANPDTEGFLGVIGVEVTGDEDSTRNVTVNNSITSGGVLGPPYFGPRTLVVRMIAVATDECSLQAGLDWLRFKSVGMHDPCLGDSMTFFDCCPCICDDKQPGGPCWARNYAELKGTPACNPTYWPDTYQDILVGPPVNDPQWCAWVDIYRELRIGPNSWSCCVDSCVVPYLRQYHNAAITVGPTVLHHPAMNSCGAMVELEMTIVAATPDEVTLPGRRAALIIEAADTVPVDDPAPPPPPPDDPFPTFHSPAVVLATRTLPPPGTLPAQWQRAEVTMAPDPGGSVLTGLLPSIRLTTFDQAAETIRVGLWLDDMRVGGFVVPFLPANAALDINGVTRQVTAYFNGTSRVVNSFVKAYDGDLFDWPDLPIALYRVTVDQEPDKVVRLEVEVRASFHGAP